MKNDNKCSGMVTGGQQGKCWQVQTGDDQWQCTLWQCVGSHGPE